MKKILLTLYFSLFSLITFAQTAYEAKLNEKAKKISTAKTINEYDNLFNEFAKLTIINDPYKWKAYYYCSLTLYNKAELILKSPKRTGVENVNGLAEKYILGSLTTEPNNKENNELLNLIREQRTKFGADKTTSDKTAL